MGEKCARGADLNSTITEKAISGIVRTIVTIYSITEERKRKGWQPMGKPKMLGMNKPYVPNNRERKRSKFPKKRVKK